MGPQYSGIDANLIPLLGRIGDAVERIDRLPLSPIHRDLHRGDVTAGVGRDEFDVVRADANW